jgi:hypothetical protein
MNPHLSLCLTLLASSVAAQALVVPIQQRTDLGADDLLDWSAAGAPFDAVGSSAIATAGGASVSLAMPNGTALVRVDEGDVVVDGWTGNFTPGEALVWTDLEPGPLSLHFASPIRGGGAQIQSQVPGPFTASIQAFSLSGSLLATFTRQGDSTFAQDGSALFLGLLSDTAEISRISFTVTASSDTGIPPLVDFALNQVSLVLGPKGVPDCDSTGCTVASLFGLMLACRALGGARRSEG